MVAHICHPSTQRQKQVGLCEFEDTLIYLASLSLPQKYS